MKYFNAHSHFPQNHDEVSVWNQFIQHSLVTDSSQLISSGIHPWHINEIDVEWCLRQLEIDIDKIDAIGESGLDRVITIPFELQKEIFLEHIKLSEKYNKPLIIHAVRTYPDIIQLRKQEKCQQPWIVHGFTGNLQSGLQLIKNGCYLSFGKMLMNGHKKTVETLKCIDPKYALFETDDDKNLTIEELYTKGAEILTIEKEQLRIEKMEIAKELFPKIEGLL
ncbi:TatD family hydrolase [Flammeovirga agarivorans]|uniref:TatD DNase family protein n=1 Tax=Flammeovirga agarivorans TaxID=2726742 RepID=A0A7X8XUE3_9BACT|nr:TatD family hydrolase [Flammeovirga agarivorans]NLR90273.1 hypothetical protein [Flammeovirga agarivorans]